MTLTLGACCRLLTEDAARFYTAQIVLALEHLHSVGIVFRDLKVSDMLLLSAQTSYDTNTYKYS